MSIKTSTVAGKGKVLWARGLVTSLDQVFQSELLEWLVPVVLYSTQVFL